MLPVSGTHKTRARVAPRGESGQPSTQVIPESFNVHMHYAWAYSLKETYTIKKES